MNISKDFLDLFNISSFNLISESITTIAILNKINGNIWHFSIANQFNNDNDLTLEVIFINKKSIQIKTSIIELGENFCTLELINTSESELNPFITKIKNLEYLDKKYGRRKEERFKINKDNYKKFSLKSLEQRVIINNIYKPCALVDVSFHGIQIVTIYDNDIKKIDNFKIAIDFDEKKIILDAHKVYISLKKSNLSDKIFANISCQLLEPINYSWKEQLFNYINQM